MSCRRAAITRHEGAGQSEGVQSEGGALSCDYVREFTASLEDEHQPLGACPDERGKYRTASYQIPNAA